VANIESAPLVARAERAAGAPDVRRIYSGAVGEGDQKTLIAEHMVEYAHEKAGLARSGAYLCRGYTRHIEEASKLVRLLGEERKRLNCQHFRRFPGSARCLFHAVPFAFP
jgi:hypothetical protein